MMRCCGIALAVAVVACGGPDADVDSDGGGGIDAGPCGALDIDPAWLDGLLAEQISKLSGATPIAGQTMLSDRASPGARTIVRDWLIGELAGYGITADRHEYGMGANVVARLPGSDATRGWILIGAHFDSVMGSPGANDNASGVAAVLATARIMQTTCRRSGVIVAFFDQEEIGLVGSTYLAGDLFTADENIAAVHTVDQVAWDSDGDRIFEIELPTAALRDQYRAAAAALGLGVPRETNTSGTDHAAFRDRGFPSIGLTEEFVGGDTTPHYHESGDTFETVDLDYTADAVRLLSSVVGADAE